jgi:hypothetical protein
VESTGVQTHFNRRDMLLREDHQAHVHGGCGGRAGTVELLTGIGSVIRRAGATDRVGRVRQRHCPDSGQFLRYSKLRRLISGTVTSPIENLAPLVRCASGAFLCRAPRRMGALGVV